MPRYLIFPEEQQTRSPNPLDDYSLADTTLLPKHFGGIAPVNIFLGENNSGKSRFMREIMRDKDLRVINLHGEPDTLNANLSTLEQTIADAGTDVLLHIRFAIRDSHSLRGDTNLLNLISPNGSSDINQLDIDVRVSLEKIRQFIADTRAQLSTRENIVNAFFSDAIGGLVDRLTALIEETGRITKIFMGIASNGALGKDFGHHYASAGYEHCFNLGPAYMIFNRYPWGSTYDSEERDVFSVEASSKTRDVQVELHALKQRMTAITASIASPSSRTYIPTLRTARTLITETGSRLESKNDIFLHTTVHDYGLAEADMTVDTGFGLYDAIDTTRNARHDGRTSFKDFEQFLSSTFFNGKTVEVVAERVRNERGGNIIVAVEGVERDIHDLGDGIQSIIMLLYPLFIADEKAWFFIEEPETHLHPGFQRLFIETVTSNKILRDKHLTLFLTTHSNHILDFALDDSNNVNIFTFRRREGVGNKSTYQIQLSSQRDIKNLTALGVQNSSVFLANCSIWVEGISDRLYFRAYLQAYLNYLAGKQKKHLSLLEGLHYTFLEYAGGNISHFDFTAQEEPFTPQKLEDIRAISISNRIMLVADLDAGKNTRHVARASQEHEGFRYVVLTVKEVENLLSPVLLAKGLKGLFRGHNFDPASLVQADYSSEYIGTYLQTKYGGLPASFIAPSGTIGGSYKRTFAEAVVSKLKWEDMGKAAQDFTKKLYAFINYHNPRLGSN